MFLAGKPVRQGAVKRSGLAREIMFMLVLKGVLLYGLWWAFFSDPQLRSMTEGLDPDLVAKTLLAPSAPSSPHNP